MWYTEMVLMLRHMTDDLGETSRLGDSRLQEAIMVGAQLTKHEVSFNYDYIIDADAYIIDPDPTDREAGTRDDAFINLVCLKTAFMLSRADFKTSAGQGIAIRDGKSSIDLKGVASSKKDVANFFKDAYDQARLEYIAGSKCPGTAIIEPFRVSYSYYGEQYHNERGFNTFN